LSLLSSPYSLPPTATPFRPSRDRGKIASILADIGYYVKKIMYLRVIILLFDGEWTPCPKGSAAGDQVVAMVTAFVRGLFKGGREKAPRQKSTVRGYTLEEV